MKSTGKFFRSTNTRRRLATGIICACVALSARAGELAVGDAVPALSAKDQFDKEFKFEAGLRFLLLGFEMDTGKQADHKLADLGAGWLEKHGAAYVLDIHTMPAVARLFALPKMRKYPQRIVLADSENLLAPFPHKPENITILVLTPAGKIKEIRYWNPTSDKLETLLMSASSQNQPL